MPNEKRRVGISMKRQIFVLLFQEMAEHREIYASWNPWHGCTKISPGCRHCYVYRQDTMYGSGIASSLARKTANFYLPIRRRRDKSWKIESGKVVFTCFTSDFLLKDADPWRDECWQMIRRRKDLWFYFFTKRIDRFMQCIPDDWEDGYENVLVGCTVENQQMADYRLPVFNALPIKHKSIIAAPLLEHIDLTPYRGSLHRRRKRNKSRSVRLRLGTLSETTMCGGKHTVQISSNRSKTAQRRKRIPDYAKIPAIPSP